MDVSRAQAITTRAWAAAAAAADARLRGDSLLFTQDVSPGDSRAMLGYPLKAFVNSRGGETSAPAMRTNEHYKRERLTGWATYQHIGLFKRALLKHEHLRGKHIDYLSL